MKRLGQDGRLYELPLLFVMLAVGLVVGLAAKSILKGVLAGLSIILILVIVGLLSLLYEKLKDFFERFAENRIIKTINAVIGILCWAVIFSLSSTAFWAMGVIVSGIASGNTWFGLGLTVSMIVSGFLGGILTVYIYRQRKKEDSGI